MRALASRLRRAGGAEDGMAIAAVVTLIGIGLAVTGAAVMATNSAIGGTTRDERSKDALAAADAALQLALFRQNQVDTNTTYPCVVVGAGGDLFAGSAAADGWCPAVTGDVGDATWSYRASPAGVSGTTKSFSIVATGNTNGVIRRVEVSAETPTATSVFANNTVVGRDWINLDSNAEINGNASTNGNITLASNSRLCGYAQVGPGKVVTPQSSQCAQYQPPTQGTISLPPVDPGLLANATSTNLFFAPEKNPGDTISGNQAEVTWNATTRSLTIDGNSSLTLGGGDYKLCRLSLKSNSVLYVAESRNVRIFFDTPENCGLPSGTAQISMDSNTRVGPTSANPASLALIVLGSETLQTRVELDSNSESTMPLIVYAPRSVIDIDSNSTYVGAIAGQSIDINSNAEIRSHQDASNFQLPVLLHYRQARYVECSPTTQLSQPDDYC
jgi:hypothetical protein